MGNVGFNQKHTDREEIFFFIFSILFNKSREQSYTLYYHFTRMLKLKGSSLYTTVIFALFWHKMAVIK